MQAVSGGVSIELALDTASDCDACASRLKALLQGHQGIDAVQVNSDGRMLVVDYDPQLCSRECMGEAAALAAREFERDFGHQVLEIGGMDCASCAQTIERAVSRIDGVTFASVNFAGARLCVEYRPAVVDPLRIASSVRALGYEVPGAGGEAVRS